MTTALITERLTKAYGNQLAVDGINLKISQSAIYGLIGPNGAGKSTTIKMLLGLIKPSSGEIHIAGHQLSGNRELCLTQVNAVLEQQGLYQELTARKNLQIVCHIRDIALSEIDPVLEFIGLSGAKNKKVCQFSLGMKQRLALGCALISKPKLLVLDEPTNGLDPVVTMELKAFIKTLPERGVTVLITSHSMSDIDDLCDEIGVLSKGQLIFQGTKIELKQQLSSKLVLEIDNKSKAFELLTKEGLSVVSGSAENQLLIDDVAYHKVAEINKRLNDEGIGIYHLAFEQPRLEQIFLNRE